MNAITLRSRAISVISLVLLLVFPLPLLAMEYSQPVSIDRQQLIFEKLADYDLVKLPAGSYLNDVGKPRLPVLELRIALPDGMRAESVRLENVSTQPLDGSYRIFPAQPPIRISEYSDNLEFVQPDLTVYGSAQPFPENQVTLVGQSDLAGQSFAVVELSPLSYFPTSGELILSTAMDVVVSGATDYECGDYLPRSASPKTVAYYRNQVSELVANTEAVQLRESQAAAKSRALPADGPFDHVIITTSSLAAYWTDLAVWHTKKGVRDTIVTTDYIYANYSGSDNQEKIRNFLIDAHDNWGTLYVLIAGEHAQVPFEYRSYVSENIPGDEYYADFDDDWMMELLVGRVTADNQAQVALFINKLMNYETNPPPIGYTLNVTLLGMDLTTDWQPPYYTLTASEETKILIDTSYIPSRFNVTTVYDSESTDHRTKFIDAMNSGAHLINHSDHSNTTIMGVGDLNHNDYISNGSVDNLTNDNRMSVIFSLGCHPNEMDHNDCIAEHFVVYNDLQAGVAFTGNTRSGWFYVGDPNTLSGVLDIKWWEGLFDHNMYHLGEALAYSKHNSPRSDSHERYCQWTLNLLGEPEMPIWTDLPSTVIAVYPDSITHSPFDFSVHTQRTHQGVIDSVYVCLWKDGDIFERGYSDENGDITFTIMPSSGVLNVTATKQNYLPFTGVAYVDVSNSAPTCIVPNDTSLLLRSGGEICLPVGCGDAEGNLDGGPTVVSGPGTVVDGSWCYMPTVDEVCQVTIQCQDLGGLVCEAQFEVNVDAYFCGDADGNDLVNISDAVYLIGYIFGGQIAPVPLASGDVDCNELVNISDAVFLISYIFGGGEAPCTGCS